MGSKKSKKLDSLGMMLAQIAVLTDHIPSKCDAIFIHVVPIHGKFFKKSHLSTIINTHKKNKFKKIVLNPLSKSVCKKNNFEYIEHEYFKKKLIENGVLENNIKNITPSFNTASEIINFLELAKKEGWKKIIISSQPHHQLRCFLQTIAIMKEINFYPKVYNLTHYEVPWNKIMKRTILNSKPFYGKFSDHIESEHKRIIKYSKNPKNGEEFRKHSTIDELLYYLDERDK